MSTTMMCNKKQQKFTCRLIIDGDRYGTWNATTLNLETPEGVDMRTQVEETASQLLINTEGYYDCNKKKGTLKCTGTEKKPKPTVEHGERKERGIWDRLLSRR